MLLLLSSILHASPGTDAAQQERAHLSRLLVWSGISASAGALQLGLGWKDPFHRNFGFQNVAWSLINGGIVAATWQGTGSARSDLEIRSTREFLNLNLGLDAGYVGVGLTLSLTGAHFEQRGLIGTGLGVGVQGLGLLILDAVLLASYPGKSR